MKVEKIEAWRTEDGKFHATAEEARRHAQIQEMVSPLREALSAAFGSSVGKEMSASGVENLAKEILKRWAIMLRSV